MQCQPGSHIPACHVHGSEKWLVAEGVGNFKTPNAGRMIQTLHEKRIISSASPMYFWAKNATAEFRGRCRIYALMLTFFSLSVSLGIKCWSFGGFVFTWQAGRWVSILYLFPSLRARWPSRTPLTSAVSSVRRICRFLSSMSQRVVLNQLMEEEGLL